MYSKAVIVAPNTPMLIPQAKGLKKIFANMNPVNNSNELQEDK